MTYYTYNVPTLIFFFFFFLNITLCRMYIICLYIYTHIHALAIVIFPVLFCSLSSVTLTIILIDIYLYVWIHYVPCTIHVYKIKYLNLNITFLTKLNLFSDQYLESCQLYLDIVYCIYLIYSRKPRCKIVIWHERMLCCLSYLGQSYNSEIYFLSILAKTSV